MHYGHKKQTKSLLSQARILSSHNFFCNFALYISNNSGKVTLFCQIHKSFLLFYLFVYGFGLWWNGRGKKTTCCRRGKRGKDVSLSTAAGAGNRDQKNAHPASGMGGGGRLWAYNWSEADTIRTLCGRVNNLVLAQEEISTKVAIIKTKDRTITTPCRWFPMSRES